MGNDLGRCVDCSCQSFDSKETVAGEAVKGGLIGAGTGALSFALGVGIGAIATAATGGAAAPFVLTGLGSATGVAAGGGAAAIGTISAIEAKNHTCRCGHAKHRHGYSTWKKRYLKSQNPKQFIFLNQQSFSTFIID